MVSPWSRVDKNHPIAAHTPTVASGTAAMRLLSALRCARCRCRSSKAQQLGFLLVHVAILAVSGSGYFVGIAWVASLAFVLACLSLALQLVRGSLTGRFSLLWVLVASYVVVYTAAA